MDRRFRFAATEAKHVAGRAGAARLHSALAKEAMKFGAEVKLRSALVIDRGKASLRPAAGGVLVDLQDTGKFLNAVVCAEN